MKLYYWLDEDKFIQEPGVIQPLTEIEGLKRGTKIPLAVQFLSGPNADVKTTLTASSALEFCLKKAGEYDGDPLAELLPADWTEPSASSQDPFYTGTLNLNTTQLEDEFLTPDGDETNDLATVDAMAGFDVTEPAYDAPRTADELACTIANKVIQGDEGLATDAGPAIETRLDKLETALPVVFLPAVTAYTGGGSSKLDGVATAGVISVGTIAMFGNAGDGPKWYKLTAGSTAESVPYVVRPDDYNVSTNNVYWALVENAVLNALSSSITTTATVPITINSVSDGVVTLRNLNAGGTTQITFLDDGDAFRMALALGNSGSGFPSVPYILTVGAATKVPFHIKQFDGSTFVTSLAVDGFGNTVLGGAHVDSIQALSGAGAVDVLTGVTRFTSSGASQALTLANGTAGQRKTIIHEVDGGSGVLTPTTKTGFTTITFTNAGDSAVLVYLATRGWMIEAIYGAVAA